MPKDERRQLIHKSSTHFCYGTKGQDQMWVDVTASSGLVLESRVFSAKMSFRFLHDGIWHMASSFDVQTKPSLLLDASQRVYQNLWCTGTIMPLQPLTPSVLIILPVLTLSTDTKHMGCKCSGDTIYKLWTVSSHNDALLVCSEYEMLWLTKRFPAARSKLQTPEAHIRIHVLRLFAFALLSFTAYRTQQTHIALMPWTTVPNGRNFPVTCGANSR